MEQAHPPLWLEGKSQLRVGFVRAALAGIRRENSAAAFTSAVAGAGHAASAASGRSPSAEIKENVRLLKAGW